ncbi:MAG: hypothetical protein RL670_81, partial [Actinomycetota bacterium]
MSSAQSEGEFGANEWLVEEMYALWKQDPNLVDKSWWPILEQHTPGANPPATPAPASTSTVSEPAAPAAANNDTGLVAKTPRVEAKAQPIPAQAPATRSIEVISDEKAEDQITVLKGMAKTLAANMDSSLEIPTATSVRSIPAKLMIDNRIVINSHLARTRGGKLSFTHILGFAIVRAIKEFPSQNVYYDIQDGKPVQVAPAHVNLGLAIDIPKPDGTRALLVPNIKRAERLNFAEYLAAYEDLVKRARDNKLAAEDFAGTTISLTNPGGIGTVHSVPRLTKGQGCIVGAGALEYPAEFQGMTENQIAKLGVSKIITLTST